MIGGLFEKAGIVPFLRDVYVLWYGAGVDEHTDHLDSGVSVEGTVVGVAVRDAELFAGVFPCTFVHLGDVLGYGLRRDGTVSVMEDDAKVFGGDGIGIPLKSISLAVDGSELHSGDLGRTGSVPAFWVGAEDEDGIAVVGDVTFVVLNHM